ncbi:hypothetical protein RHECNPAF_12600133 [Rhizobium etli CNPAF512]|nr:hypothetical protein RHECNPAF_12600133 [Rhizobium etli CNPAF512]
MRHLRRVHNGIRRPSRRLGSKSSTFFCYRWSD